MCNDIEGFIRAFKFKNAKELEDIFTNGNCYHFSVILKQLFPCGKIVYDYLRGHFLFYYHENYYDITGKTQADETSIIDIRYMDRLEQYKLERDCAYKGIGNWLYFS